jgi:transposase-like protein
MLAAALEAEVQEYIERYKGDRDADGRALVVRNGKAKERTLALGAGVVRIAAPRVNDKRADEEGVRRRFTSNVLPRYMRRSPKLTEVLPLLYLHGLSSGDFREALPALLGADAAGLSPSTIIRLTASWEEEHKAFRTRDLADRDYVYVWVDGIHFKIRLEDDNLCTLVMIGALPDGTKEIVAVEDGFRESTESWLTLLRDLKAHGMRAPALAVGDGALGFWAARRQVWPETREQRCWVHRIANVLDKLPKRLQPRAKGALHDIMEAETRDDALKDITAFTTEYQAKYPKAVDSLTRDQDKLLTFFDFPAEHWRHLRTTNVIESPFASVRARERVTKGAGSRKKGLAMAFKLLQTAETSWRKLNGSHQLPKVRAGVQFEDGLEVRTVTTNDQASEELAA